MLMIQTCSTSRGASTAGSFGHALPLLRCMQPYVREPASTPTTPRTPTNAGAQDASAGVWRAAEEDCAVRTARALAPPQQGISALGVTSRHKTRFAERAQLMGPAPTLAPALATAPLVRAELCDAWRMIAPELAELAPQELLGRIYALLVLKDRFFAEAPPCLRGDMERLIACAGRHGGNQLRAMSARLHSAVAHDDTLTAAQGPAARVGELLMMLVSALDDEDDASRGPALKRRMLSKQGHSGVAAMLELRRADTLGMAELERMKHFTQLFHPQAGAALP